MSQTALCHVVKDPWFADQDAAAQAALVKAMLALLAEEDVAVDINAYRDAPTGLRIWAVDGRPAGHRTASSRVDWAYETVRAAPQGRGLTPTKHNSRRTAKGAAPCRKYLSVTSSARRPWRFSRPRRRGGREDRAGACRARRHHPRV